VCGEGAAARERIAGAGCARAPRSRNSNDALVEKILERVMAGQQGEWGSRDALCCLVGCRWFFCFCRGVRFPGRLLCGLELGGRARHGGLPRGGLL
jgi:hypothetical protein